MSDSNDSTGTITWTWIGDCSGPPIFSFASANPSLARERLGWSARAQMPDVVRMMMAAELAESAS